jgi:DNA-directed RNA polymerase subunit K/omega
MDDDNQSIPASSDTEIEIVDAASVIDEDESDQYSGNEVDDEVGGENEDEDEDEENVNVLLDIPPVTASSSKAPAKRGRPKQSGSKKKAKKQAPTTAGADSDMDEDIYQKIQTNEIVVDSSEEDEPDDDTEYQKLAHSAFQSSIEKSFAVFERPRKEEIELLTILHRDKDNNICDPTHTTVPWLTMYERARVLSVRVSQLEYGAIPMVSVTPEMKYTNYMIAVKELEQKKLSFIIQRPLPDNRCEYWNVNDLQLIH